MKVAILGFGVEGKSALAYWQQQGHEVTICDTNAKVDVPDGVDARLGENAFANLDQFDLIVRSPGVRPQDFVTPKPVTSVTREFMAKCPALVIGVTGTKGKGTTSSLIAEILMKAGKKVWLGGNIGVPALDFLANVQASDYVVLEMSSFQLMDVTSSPQIAVMLMLAPDHLNYHEDLSEYHEAKANIFRYQRTNDLAIFNAADPKTAELVALSPAPHIPYLDTRGAYVRDDAIWYADHRICMTDDVGLVGKHNLENVCAAVAATWNIVGDPVPMAQAIRAFKGLPHRLEEVAEVGGVKYFDDSFAVNPTAAASGINSIEAPKVVILGGFNRGLDIEPIVQAVGANHVKHVVLIGQTADKLAEALHSAGFKNVSRGGATMSEIVSQAAAQASPGDVVLLSPGFASFDMFANYKVRGEEFKAAVQELSL